MTPEVRDAQGTAHPLEATDARIVSLVPSLTELLCDLGLGPQLVGRTGFCIHPAQTVAAVPKVGGTKDVNLERIRGLAPSHVIVNIDENKRDTAEALATFVPHVVVTHPKTVTDNFSLYANFGAWFGARERAQQLTEALEAALAGARAMRFAPLSVLYLIWRAPWMTVSADTYVADMLALANLRQLAVADAARYPTIDLDTLAPCADALLFASEPCRFVAADALAAERQLQVLARLVDGEMLSWYGSRAIRGVRYLTALRTQLDAARAAPLLR